MVDMMRVWPLVIQFGIGGLMCLGGLWCGIQSGYLDLKSRTAWRVIGVTIAGYLGLLGLGILFTFHAPFWG